MEFLIDSLQKVLEHGECRIQLCRAKLIERDLASLLVPAGEAEFGQHRGQAASLRDRRFELEHAVEVDAAVRGGLRAQWCYSFQSHVDLQLGRYGQALFRLRLSRFQFSILHEQIVERFPKVYLFGNPRRLGKIVQ
jgi:hypothetical protein